MNIYFVSLGCDKNTVDSEEMLGLLNESGYSFISDPVEADVIVINTCCFIHDAKEESIMTIIELASMKKTAKCKALVVTGCLAERYRKEIIEQIPEVDALVGTNSYTEIVNAIKNALERNSDNDACYQAYKPLDLLESSDGRQIVTTVGGYYAYLKIAEGCDKNCTYCIIPSIRGNYRSVPMEKLLKRANELVAGGAKEIILVAQETTLYGVDLYGSKTLPKLLKELCKIEGLEWVRIMYCYPEEITDELIETIKNETKVCNYIDMPIQHANNQILKKMGRRTTKEDLLDIINKIHRAVPDIVIRTTLITGFPGESIDYYNELREFVEEVEFERLGVFTYSQEEDTPAALFDEQIAEEVKENRRAGLMQIQQEITSEFLRAQVGRTLRIMIEGRVYDAEENVYMGRSYMDAPDIDGNVYVKCDEEIISGDFVDVKIVGSSEYDLYAEIIQVECTKK